MHVYIAIQWNTLLCRTARHCQKTCTIGGVTILEGSLVVIPIYSLHHSPEYWENPEEFEPERCDNILCFHLPFTPYLTCTFFPFACFFSLSPFYFFPSLHTHHTHTVSTLIWKPNDIHWCICHLGGVLVIVLEVGLLWWKQRWLSSVLWNTTSFKDH